MPEKTLGQARALFAKNLKRIRQEKGLSQEQLADIARVHRTYVGAVERLERNLSLDNIERFAQALDVSILEFFQDGEE